MEQKQSFLSSRLWRERILPGAAFFAILYEFTFFLVQPMLPKAIFQSFAATRPAAFVCEGLLLLGVLLSREKNRSFLLLNACWLLITRCFLSDLGASAQISIQLTILFVCFFHCFAFLGKKQRDLLYALITLELTGLLTLWALFGIVTAITGRPTAYNGISFSIETTEPLLVFISFFGIHRNLAATYYVCAAAMLLYHCGKTNAFRWKGLTFLFLPLAFCAIAIQHSRSNYLAFALLLGLILVGSFTQLKRWPRGLAGNAAAICALVLSVTVVFMSMGAASDGMSALSQAKQETPPAETRAGEEPDAEIEAPAVFSGSGNTPGDSPATAELSGSGNTPGDSPAPAEFSGSGNTPGNSPALTGLSDTRNTIADSLTLTGRTEIWMAGLLTIRENPSIALTGQPVESIMTRVNQILESITTRGDQIVDHPYTHMHNALMQQLMMSGVPGMVICCLFILSLLKKIVLDVCYRRKKKGVMQPLAALLLALLVYGMFEPLLYKGVAVSSLLFCLSAGLLDAELRDHS